MKVTALTDFLHNIDRWSSGDTKETTQTIARELLAAGLVKLGETDGEQSPEVSKPEVLTPAKRETKPRKQKLETK